MPLNLIWLAEFSQEYPPCPSSWKLSIDGRQANEPIIWAPAVACALGQAHQCLADWPVLACLERLSTNILIAVVIDVPCRGQRAFAKVLGISIFNLSFCPFYAARQSYRR